VRVLVFPDPGGARTCNTGAVEVTAADWAAFRPFKIASIQRQDDEYLMEICADFEV
jgi:hypothetical protein